MAENTNGELVCYSLRAPVKGYFRAWGISGISTQLTKKSITPFEWLIQDSLYDAIKKGSFASDPDGLFAYFSVEKIKEKIVAERFSVINRNGALYGNIELQTKGHLSKWERQALSGYVEERFRKEGGRRFLDKKINFSEGSLDVWLYPPKQYCFKKRKKYEITDVAHPEYPWLHRIRALKSVRICKGIEVRAGDMGGYIQSEKNLSQEGGCWVGDNAVCFGDAVVEEDAKLLNLAVAKDSARISGDSEMSGEARAEGNCRIQGGNITGRALISGEAAIRKDHEGHAPCIAGNSRVYGTVRGRNMVNGTVFPGEVYNDPADRAAVMEGGIRGIEGPKDRAKAEKKRSSPER